ncbi:MAG TPA: ribbon-helix-helix protein, CopG family [Actinomycetota bacterium]|nr:ribbon-helix-helix protein, CopG family [Actinomycetota bacterium]
MRTTITLDEDVAAAVEQVRRERSVGMSQAINDLIRAGLAAKPVRRPFKQKSYPMGLLIDVSSIANAIEYLEGPFAR